MMTFETRGEYLIKKYKRDGTLVQEVGPIKNLITNRGLDAIAVGSGLFSQYMFVGTGTTPPAVTDSGMSAYLAKTSTLQDQSSGNLGSPDYVGYHSVTYRFGEGAAAGNLTEVGIGYLEYDTSTPPVEFRRPCSRALIVDALGNPVTITVLSDEYLDVTYTLYVYPPKTDYSSSVTISGVSYGYTVRLANAASTQVYLAASSQQTFYSVFKSYNTTSAALTLGAITDPGPTGEDSFQLYSPTFVDSAYSPGSYTCNSTCTIPLSDYPPTGQSIRGCVLLIMGVLSCSYQIVFTTGIPKTKTKKLVLNLSYSWARK